MTLPESAPKQRRSRFSTPARGAETDLLVDSTIESLDPWTRPSPLIVQHRAKAVERAIALESLIRVGVLLLADLFILFVAHAAVDAARRNDTLAETLRGLLAQVLPRGIFPRAEVVTAVILGLLIFGNYRGGSRWHNPRVLFAGSTLGLSLVFWSALWSGVSAEAGGGFILVVAAVGLVISAGRQALYYAVREIRPTPLATSRAIVLGSRTHAESLLRSEAVKLDRRLLVLGYVTPEGRVDSQSMGVLSDLVWIIERHDVDAIIIAEQLEEDALVDVLEVAERTGCAAVAGYPFFPLGGFIPKVVSRQYVPYVTIVRPSLRVPQLVSKRAFDVVMSTLILIVLSPLLALIALAIRLTSGGPVVFKQTRVGYDGRPFQMYKFRSMVNGAEAMKKDLQSQSIYADPRTFKVPNDPRVTSLGRFLRRSSLDEFPQLWNVVRGEMSLVGPRPPLADEVEKYEEHNYTRFDMKPGITGPWQVSGRNEIMDFEQIIALETDYLTDWSLTKDFSILLKTIPAVVSMKGAL